MIRSIRFLSAAVLAAAFCFVASAEELDRHQTELVGFVGGHSYGRTIVGGSIQNSKTARELSAFEFGYVTGDNKHILALDWNQHFLFPLKTRKKLTPYMLVGVGLGVGHSTYIFRGTPRKTPDGFFGLNLGGGTRFRMGRDWGLRPEVKFLLFPGSTNVRVTFSIYRRIDKH